MNARADIIRKVAPLIIGLTPLLLIVCALYSIAVMVLAQRGMPLWFDESWSALIQQSGSFDLWMYRAWSDSSAPLYYVALTLWPLRDDDGMRLLSLFFFVAAALTAALWRAPGVPRGAAALWGLLLILWGPGQPIMLDARYYALLLLLSVAQTIAFLRLLSRPVLGTAMVWSILSSLVILTHYYSAVITAFEGLILLWVCRANLTKLLPSLVPFVVPFAWLIYHAPRLLVYAQPEVAWYPLVRLRGLPAWMILPIADNYLLPLIVAAIVVATRSRARFPRGPLLVLAAAIGTMVILLVAGSVRPMLTPRYLLPVMPPALLAISLSVTPIGRPLLALAFLTQLLGFNGLREQLRTRSVNGLELPAKALPRAKIVTWTIDYPGAKVLDPDSTRAILSDAFWRNGRLITPRWGDDWANGDAIVWLYDEKSRARVEKLKRQWDCIDRPLSNGGTLSCQRKS